MCLIAFGWKAHSKYKLVLAANRDEFYDRPARSASSWQDEGLPDIYAGKDMKAGGTWFGIHKNGEWGAVTNIRKPGKQKVNPPSRGELVLNYLRDEANAIQYLQKLNNVADDYMGFNLLLGNKNELFSYSNEIKETEEVPSGIHGISNAFINSNWPKVLIAKEKLKRILDSEKVNTADLFEMLADEQKASDDELPDTGISRELEREVSSIFIKTEVYGTRCSTLLLIDNKGNIEFHERSFKPASTEIHDEKKFIIRSDQ